MKGDFQMYQVILYFSNGDCLTLNAGDLITPIVYPAPNSASMSGNYSLEIHVHNGLIPSLMGAFYKSRFFYVNNDMDVIYGSNTIVKIEVK